MKSILLHKFNIINPVQQLNSSCSTIDFFYPQPINPFKSGGFFQVNKKH